MIIPHDELRLAAKLRSSLIAVLDGIADTSGLLPFSGASPNRPMRQRIEDVASRLQKELFALGAIPIELHAHCGRPEHPDMASSLGRSTRHWCISVPGQDMAAVAPVRDGPGLVRLDGRLYITDLDDALSFQTMTRKGCPCSPSGRQEEHSVSRHLAWPPDPESSIGELAGIHNQLIVAVRTAADKHSRSSIREELLLALLELERLIVPETADEHIAIRHVLDDLRPNQEKPSLSEAERI